MYIAKNTLILMHHSSMPAPSVPLPPYRYKDGYVRVNWNVVVMLYKHLNDTRALVNNLLVSYISNNKQLLSECKKGKLERAKTIFSASNSFNIDPESPVMNNKATDEYKASSVSNIKKLLVSNFLEDALSDDLNDLKSTESTLEEELKAWLESIIHNKKRVVSNDGDTDIKGLYTAFKKTKPKIWSTDYTKAKIPCFCGFHTISIMTDEPSAFLPLIIHRSNENSPFFFCDSSTDGCNTFLLEKWIAARMYGSRVVVWYEAPVYDHCIKGKPTKLHYELPRTHPVRTLANSVTFIKSTRQYTIGFLNPIDIYLQGKRNVKWSRIGELITAQLDSRMHSYPPVPVLYSSARRRWEITSGLHRLVTCVVLGVPLKVQISNPIDHHTKKKY